MAPLRRPNADKPNIPQRNIEVVKMTSVSQIEGSA